MEFKEGDEVVILVGIHKDKRATVRAVAPLSLLLYIPDVIQVISYHPKEIKKIP